MFLNSTSLKLREKFEININLNLHYSFIWHLKVIQLHDGQSYTSTVTMNTAVVTYLISNMLTPYCIFRHLDYRIRYLFVYLFVSSIITHILPSITPFTHSFTKQVVVRPLFSSSNEPSNLKFVAWSVLSTCCLTHLITFNNT